MKKEVGIMKSKSGAMDFGMFVITITLLCIGIVMVASASSYHALISYGDSNYLFIRQLLFAVAGVVGMIIISKFDYRKYKRWSYLAFGLAAILLLLVITPLGVTRNGAKRWLGIGLLTFQPSEAMKPIIVLAMATYFSRNYKRIGDWKTFVIPGIMTLVVIILMYLQKHMSGMLILVIAAMSVFFVVLPKMKIKHILAILLIIVSAGGAFLMSQDFRKERIFNFFNPEENIQDGNWQPAQSLYAIGSGGLFGRGIGQSRQKYLWLPEAQNDFIFSIIAEELGFVGAASIMILFGIFIYKGFKIALTCKDMYGSLIATGIMTVFAIQIVVNIAVVTCSMPVTGMPLPLFSYGGTSLLFNLCSIGILLNISKNCEKI